MKAAVCRSFGAPLSIEDVHLAAPGPGEIRVDVAACAICHSDIAYIDGSWGGDLPAVYGHEAAGIVAEVGPGVEGFELGDRVVVTLIRSCGACRSCTAEVPVGCSTTFPLDDASPLSDTTGTPLTHGMRTGAFAEEVVVHASQAVVIPPQISLDAASLLACGVITGVGAVTNTAEVPPGSSVVVIGTGGVGLNAVQGAALAGADIIVAIDLSAAKQAAALDFGATHAAGPAEAVARVAEATEGRMADYVFVTVGAKAAFDQSFELLAPLGAVVLVGMPASGVTSEIDPGTIAALNQRVLGSKMGTSVIETDIPRLVDSYQAGSLKLDELITNRYPLEAINEAIAEVKSGNALRNVIVFPGATEVAS